MKQKNKLDKPSCTETIVIRVTPQQKQQVAEIAEKAGLTISRYGRRALLGQRIRARLTEREVVVLSNLEDIRGDLVNIQNALNGTPEDVKLQLFKSPDFMYKWITAINSEVQYLQSVIDNLKK